jgi:hypothetical protein
MIGRQVDRSGHPMTMTMMIIIIMLVNQAPGPQRHDDAGKHREPIDPISPSLCLSLSLLSFLSD